MINDEGDILVGQVLRRLREEQGLTQGQVAQRYNTPQSVVSKLESGERSLYLRECFSYAKALGILPDMLYYQVVRAHVDYAKSLA